MDVGSYLCGTASNLINEYTLPLRVSMLSQTEITFSARFFARVLNSESFMLFNPFGEVLNIVQSEVVHSVHSEVLFSTK